MTSVRIPPPPQINPRAAGISGSLKAQVTYHTKHQSRPSHLVSLLELRHVKPDEALHGKKQKYVKERQEAGRAQARVLNYPGLQVTAA